MTEAITTNDVDVNVNVKTVSYQVVVANGLFYTTEDNSPLVLDGSNTYLIIKDGIQIKVTGIDINVKESR